MSSIIIHGITQEEFARRMMGEGIVKIHPDILGSCDSFFGYPIQEIPPHGDLIDRDRLPRQVIFFKEDNGRTRSMIEVGAIWEEPAVIKADRPVIMNSLSFLDEIEEKEEKWNG